MLRPSTFRCALEYACRRTGKWRAGGGDVPTTEQDGFSNDDLSGYPNNHNYWISGGRIVPSFGLYRRSRQIEAFYPERIESFLDVGSCRGWFVFRAAERPECVRAVGIDVHRPFISSARKVAAYLERDEVSFHSVFLRALFDEPSRFGAPFDTILVINTYHYLFWGSAISPERFSGHAEFIDGLAEISSGQVIFSSPLAIEHCPRETREAAEREPERAAAYTSERFLEAARERFRVVEAGRLAKWRPVWLLERREEAASGDR